MTKARMEAAEVPTNEPESEGPSDGVDGKPFPFREWDWEENGLDGTRMWVFGYGSLCWHQGFTFEKSMTGFVRGFSRKFWQGNTTHRGTLKKPGRVATLIEDEEGVVWGQAFQVREKEAFSYLNNRECQLGGYLTTITTFYPRKQTTDVDKSIKPFPVILYLATPSNRHWLGDSPLSEIANQIVECTGDSGHNVEYLLRLAEFVRDNIPEAVDDHLFTLEHLVRSRIEERNLCLEILMGERKSVVKLDGVDSVAGSRPSPGGGRDDVDVGDDDDDDAEVQTRNQTAPFTSTVLRKKLRCVNI